MKQWEGVGRGGCEGRRVKQWEGVRGGGEAVGGCEGRRVRRRGLRADV